VSDDHYFTAQPASPGELRTISVRLAGHDGTVETAGGIFSPAHIDLGTTVLLRHVPAPPPGNLLDLGCGWGPLALTAALQGADTTVWALDVNERSLDLMARNAALWRVEERVRAVLPADVPEDLRFDAIWSNPPIRIGKPELHALLARWIPRLNPGACAYLVVQRNLGADSLANWIKDQTDDAGVPWGTVAKVGSAKGFRVFSVRRSGAAG